MKTTKATSIFNKMISASTNARVYERKKATETKVIDSMLYQIMLQKLKNTFQSRADLLQTLQLCGVCKNENKANKSGAPSTSSISLTLLETTFSSTDARVLSKIGASSYSECLSSLGKKYFDAFKRCHSTHIVFDNGMNIVSNVPQLRFIYLASKSGVVDFTINNRKLTQQISREKRGRKRKRTEESGENNKKTTKKRIHKNLCFAKSFVDIEF